METTELGEVQVLSQEAQPQSTQQFTTLLTAPQAHSTHSVTHQGLSLHRHKRLSPEAKCSRPQDQLLGCMVSQYLPIRMLS